MAKVLESLIAKGRKSNRPPDQKEVAFGLADLSTHGMLNFTTGQMINVCETYETIRYFMQRNYLKD